jgi:hypothetical protein
MVAKKTVLGLVILGLLLGLASLQLAAASHPDAARFQLLGVARATGTSGALSGFSTITVTVTSTVGPVFLFQLEVELSSSQTSSPTLSTITIDGVITPTSSGICSSSACKQCPSVYWPSSTYLEVIPLINSACYPGLFVTDPLGNSAIPFATSISIAVTFGTTFSQGTTATAEATMSGPLIATATVSVTGS